MIIIGIDPGSRITGYGVIRKEGSQTVYVASGYIRVINDDWGLRLQQIYTGLKEVIHNHNPQVAAIEQVFVHQNPNSALKLGQARGAAIVALTIPLSEYSARQVKQAVVGMGAAKKDQVQHMVSCLLGLSSKSLQADEADALAIALCHAHSSGFAQLMRPPKRKKRSSWRAYLPNEYLDNK